MTNQNGCINHSPWLCLEKEVWKRHPKQKPSTLCNRLKFWLKYKSALVSSDGKGWDLKCINKVCTYRQEFWKCYSVLYFRNSKVVGAMRPRSAAPFFVFPSFICYCFWVVQKKMALTKTINPLAYHWCLSGRKISHQDTNICSLSD